MGLEAVALKLAPCLAALDEAAEKLEKLAGLGTRRTWIAGTTRTELSAKRTSKTLLPAS